MAGVAVGSCVALANVPVGPAAIPNQAHCAFPLDHIVYQPVFCANRPGACWLLGPIRIFSGGVEAAILYTVRFFLLLIAGSLLMLTTTPTSLTDGVRQNVFAPLERLGVPVSQGALVLSIALRFVPTLAQEADNIIAAQTARGADLENKGALAYARACVPPSGTAVCKRASPCGQPGPRAEMPAVTPGDALPHPLP